MNIEKIKETLRKQEGLRLKPYKDTEGYLTIGYGWRIGANVMPPEIDAYLKQHGEITFDMAETLLDISARLAIGQTTGLLPDLFKYTENRQEALVNLTFNMGPRKLQKGFPSFCAAVKREDWIRAADELKYSNGLKKEKLSDYWLQLHGEKPSSRPATIYRMLKEG